MCLDIGITPSLFWDYSVGELQDLINSYNRRRLNENKEKAIFFGVLSKQIGEQVAMLFGDKVEPKQIWEYYPNLFGEEKVLIEEEQRKIQLELHKARMKDYMYRHNVKIGGDK